MGLVVLVGSGSNCLIGSFIFCSVCCDSTKLISKDSTNGNGLMSNLGRFISNQPTTPCIVTTNVATAIRFFGLIGIDGSIIGVVIIHKD